VSLFGVELGQQLQLGRVCEVMRVLPGWLWAEYDRAYEAAAGRWADPRPGRRRPVRGPPDRAAGPGSRPARRPRGRRRGPAAPAARRRLRAAVLSVRCAVLSGHDPQVLQW